MIPTLRTMTKKSKLNFGKYRDKTILQIETCIINGYKKRLRNRDGADRMKRESKPWSRSMLQRYNQGH